MDIYSSINLCVSIERTGPSQSGQYLTMRKRDMTGIVCPLDQYFFHGVGTIGIGDGGNEVGMGKVIDVLNNVDCKIPNSRDIACVVPADHLIVASVSNWGGYALAGAIGVLAAEECENEDDKMDVIRASLPSSELETTMCIALVNAGARDGMTASNDVFGAAIVDGMPLAKSLEILESIRSIAFE